MLRELFISIYLFIFSVLFGISNLFPYKKKVVFCLSFVENNILIYKELKARNSNIPCVLLASNTKSYQYLKNQGFIQNNLFFFTPKNPLSFIKSIYHLATAKVVIIDNYYGFLAVAKFKTNVQKLQIWHANGAIKKFGLEDPSIAKRTHQAKKRFLSVYNQFDHILVGSIEMEEIFMKAFDASSKQILRLGIPRTDIFFQQKEIEEIKLQLYTDYPLFQKKKVILYAPTFRDDDVKHFSPPLELDKLQHELGDEYVFLIKLHPAIKNSLNISKYKDFIWDFSSYNKINDLLFITDFLITDYSSIPFEFSFMKKPMIFYPYDLVEYTSSRGFWMKYDELVPGPIVYNTDELISNIKNDKMELKQVEAFHQQWNEYSVGKSSENVANQILHWINTDN